MKFDQRHCKMQNTDKLRDRNPRRRFAPVYTEKIKNKKKT